MGFITKQFLQGFTARNRSYSPSEVSFTLASTVDEWSTACKVVLDMQATSSNKDYQVAYFTGPDLDKLLPDMTQAASSVTRYKIAFDVLQGFEDAALISFLSELLASRAAVPSIIASRK